MKTIKRMKRWMGLPRFLLLLMVVMVPLSSAANETNMVVGRIFYVEGDLLRYVSAEKDWVAVVRDVPFGTEDTFFSGDQGKAELIIPNGTWIRIGNSTQIQFISLDTDLAEIDVASGVGRFYNKSSDTVIKVTSPFGYVLAYPGTVFDFYVGENSVEVVPVKGKVSFVHSETEAKYIVAAGSPSILADQRQVSSGEGTVDPDWNRWNGARENFWATKARNKGRSFEYLPPSLRDESYALDENGRWERVPYEGSERWFWRPTTVGASWSPFTVGRWTDWYEDQTWIPAEPFGYITHHYGNWVYVRNYWYWAPPVVSVRVGLPLLNLGFFWYPGRVSWIHTGTSVGWVPLAPRETYYSHHRWGDPHAVVVTNTNFAQININLRNYAYANRAIVVPQKEFYGVSDYRKVRVTNINSATIINNYHAVPIINNTVIKDYATDKQRYNFANIKVNEKPHNTVLNRIQQNQALIRKGRQEKASVVQERVKSIPEGKVNRQVRIETPKVTNHLVPAGEMNRPKAEIKFQQREIKTGGKPSQPEKPGARPERVAPARPSQQEKPAARPERVKPPKPSQKEKPGQPAPPTPRPERVSPPKPGQAEKPAARPERVAPARPSQQEKPAARPERVKPPKPSQKEKPGQPAPPTPRPERVSPPKPGQAEKPAARPERVAPARPNQQEKPAARPERVKPPKPSQKEKPGQPAPPTPRPERVSPPKPGQAGEAGCTA